MTVTKAALVPIVVALTATGCVYDTVGSSTGAVVATVSDCDVVGVGVFATGEVFAGEASDIVGVESINWVHDAPGIEFITLTPAPDGIECRLNGVTSADFFGTGTATVNGLGGYGYSIEIEDNRAAPSEECSGSHDGGGHAHHSHGHGRGHDRHDHDRVGHDHDDGETCVSVPAFGDPDFYSIQIRDPSGVRIYTFAGLVEDGDIAITLLP